MKSKVFLIVFFLFTSLAFVNAQTKDPNAGNEAPAMSTGVNAPEVNAGTPDNPNTPDNPTTGGKIVKTQKPVAQSNEKVSVTRSGKSTTTVPKKKFALVKTGKTTSSK